MGCGTSSQMENVTPPSSVYLENQQNKPPTHSQIPPQQLKAIQNQPPTLISSLNHIPEVHSVNAIDPSDPIESKKEEQRTATAATEQLKHEAMKHVPQGKAFIFGQSQQQHCEKMQFSILSNRTQLPNTPQKYMPKDVIFQQSQELVSSNLFNSNSRPPYNFMFITFISDDTIFLSGGINFAFDYISDESFYFRVASIANEQPQPRRKKGGNNNLVGNKFQKLAPMRQRRYSHMGAYFRMGKLGYIYVFGGSIQDEQLLASCEQYSLEEKKWREITPMKHPRSTGFSLIFKNKIYVFGGYTADKKRSKTIEAYDPYKNYWENLNVKLHRGIQAGLLFSVKSNEVLLMGGNVESGALKSVIRINLAEQTYIWDSTMKNERLLQKGVKFNDLIYVFGGDFQDSFEKYSIKDRKWKDHQFSYNEFVSIDDINSYRMATETLQVPFDQTLLTKQDNNSNDFERYHIFGNDNFPTILQLNLTKWVLKKKVVPMALRLRCHMGVAKLQQGKYFVCGGIDSFGEKPSRASFIYYAGTNRAIEVAKMNSKKYNFAICSTPKHVYIFGGKSQSGEIINQCQKYSFDQQKWITLPNLPSQRCNSRALLVGTKIFLIGGVDMLQSVTIIDIFDTQTDTFLQHKQTLSMPSEIKALYLQQQEGSPPGIFLLSHNEVLSKYSCHYLPLKIDQNKVQEEQPTQKIEDNFSLIRQIQERQVNIKIPPFTQAFSHQNRLHLITPKGLFSWQPKNNEKIEHKFESQIVINQVQMLQFPIQKFSYPILSNLQTSN